MTNRGLKTINVVPCYPSPHAANDVGGTENHQPQCESGHMLEHSVSNVLSCRKPPTAYWFLTLGNEIKVTGRNVGKCRAGYCTVRKIQTFIPNATPYLSHQEVPVVLCGHCSAMRNKLANNGTLNVIHYHDHQFDSGRILMDFLLPW
ncbi:uncharacterized protein TNCV_2029561 [Trichonephila clavipes]|nr:uncharacterized protein TNCV_2029561 [Trichonephila clavipes]